MSHVLNAENSIYAFLTTGYLLSLFDVFGGCEGIRSPGLFFARHVKIEWSVIAASASIYYVNIERAFMLASMMRS